MDIYSLKLHQIKEALDRLGLNNAVTEMGAIELLAKEVKEGSERVADALLEVAASLRK